MLVGCVVQGEERSAEIREVRGGGSGQKTERGKSADYRVCPGSDVQATLRS